MMRPDDLSRRGALRIGRRVWKVSGQVSGIGRKLQELVGIASVPTVPGPAKTGLSTAARDLGAISPQQSFVPERVEDREHQQGEEERRDHPSDHGGGDPLHDLGPCTGAPE